MASVGGVILIMLGLNSWVIEMKRLFLLILLWPAVSFSLEGTGSVDFNSSVRPLLNQNTTLKEFVLCSFDIVSDPMGTRIGDVQSKALGGSRTGPYSMWANWHGKSGTRPVILTVNTQVTFEDKSGLLVDGDLSKAVRVVERVESVTIEPPDADQPLTTPGGFKHTIDEKSCAR